MVHRPLSSATLWLYPSFFPLTGECCLLWFPVRLLTDIWVVSSVGGVGGKSPATVETFPGPVAPRRQPQGTPHCSLAPGLRPSHITALGASSEGHLRLAPQATEAGPTPSYASRQLCPDDASVSTLSAPSARGTLREQHFMLRPELLGRKEPPLHLVLGSALLSPPYPVTDNRTWDPSHFPFQLGFRETQNYGSYNLDSLKKICPFFVSMGLPFVCPALSVIFRMAPCLVTVRLAP